MNIKIVGTGSALAGQIRTNQDIEAMVDTTDSWIRERTGIRTRHISDRDTVASLSAKACREALKCAKKEVEDIDLILVATCSPEFLLPNCACQVQSILGAEKATAFDINAACSGFLFALDTAYAYISCGIYRNALVVGGEVLSKLVDWEDRTTCVLFGDGAGAVYVEACEDGISGIQSMVQGSIQICDPPGTSLYRGGCKKSRTYCTGYRSVYTSSGQYAYSGDNWQAAEYWNG